MTRETPISNKSSALYKHLYRLSDVADHKKSKRCNRRTGVLTKINKFIMGRAD